jgi:SAM-dependent methyltransferase
MKTEEKEMQCCITHCETPLDQNYWNERWEKDDTGWDIGHASPAITDYMKQYPYKNASILIPGCGNAYEAQYLVDNGFTDITLIDIAPNAVDLIKVKFSNTPQVKVLCEDFFKHQGAYDLIIEQTFFCAIPPSRRKEYAEKTASLLNEDGKIIGVLFDKQFNQPFPPFGGCPCEYKPIFEKHFTIKKMDMCYNSIPPRAESEVFINLIKK